MELQFVEVKCSGHALNGFSGFSIIANVAQFLSNTARIGYRQQPDVN